MNLRKAVSELREEAAALGQAEREPMPFADWLPALWPAWRWDWPHVAYMLAQLERVTAGEIDRLMIFMPPRHGKTALVTVRYPAWLLEQSPATRIILGAYNQTLAETFSRQVRRIARTRLLLNNERQAAGEWETALGGGVYATGVGTGVTGRGGDLIIIDDPVKSREEASSPAYKERVWDWYTNDLFTRREPGAAIILIMTRWADDDLAGRILASADGDRWTVVSLPALAEENDPLGRSPGAALCPDRFDEDALAEIRIVLGNDFHALYQQRPVPREGAMLKRHWFPIVPAAPAFARRVRWWDKAATDGAGDYTAGVLMARSSDGLFFVEDVVRGQWSAGERERVIRATAEQDRALRGAVEVWLEQEPGSGGKESAEATIRALAGFVAHAERSTGDKQTRAEPFAAQAEAGNVCIVAGPWNEAYLQELTLFPSGAHDDQVDATAGAFNKLALSDNRRITLARLPQGAARSNWYGGGNR